ncbi:tetratricopeptide repeat-containing sulfotransferase family protein [Congregibacter litoralis]|uniref:Tetratricopeptide repeat protein/Sulfotransferase family n=1 Tax=Congregibacter litoralis KT71 TaxID=314285 RepID=A4A8E2_9GAMM|nr:sulfotransferase [Congregibacter litoralis]EAQ97937.1 Tetratricopeptide repeat protein/Sulfotransferase family [Congregibacter litoralis KT71]
MTQQQPPEAVWLKAKLREGYDRLQRGDQNGAAQCCRQILQRKPDLPEGHFLVGMIALETNDIRTAIQGFGSVTKLQPDHGAAWAQLARIFIRRGQVNRAEDALEKAVAHADDNPAIQDTIASVYTLLGNAAAASPWQEKALQHQPANIGFVINRANNLMFLGDFSRARELLESAIARHPGHANAHWLLSGLEKARNHNHITVLREILDRESRNDRDTAFLSYALGKELEDLKEWPQAFDAFARGAAARRRTLSYDEQGEIDFFEMLSATYTRDWLSSRAPGNDSHAPIFIVGQPRTGTTLVERIISSHSAVHSAGELRQFEGACRRLLGARGDGSLKAVFAEAATLDPKKLGSAYMRLTQPMQGDGSHFVDKLPANFRFVPLILAALPNAKIIHVRRSPMDACFASFKQLFADAYPHSYEQGEMARHHARYYQLMSDWRERFGLRYHEVDYEAVAADPEPQARALLSFIQLPWEDQCLDFYNQRGAVTTASVVQVREAAHTRSVGRWRRYEKQLAPMRQTLEELKIPLDHQALSP